MSKVGFEIVIFTCGEKNYADPILDKLDPKGLYLSHRLYRDSCSIDKFGVFYKDLSKLGRNLSKTLIVDNLSRNFDKQPDNGILITSWYSDSKDKELEKLEITFKSMMK
jgi:CTD small phosphatase-like protein 2